jgi:hypothetical protein
LNIHALLAQMTVLAAKAFVFAIERVRQRAS